MAQTHWQQPWAQRPAEESALFNPAFCGELIARAVADYTAKRDAPLPFALAFVVLPLVLHPVTRSALPTRSDTTFSTWAAEHGVVIAEVPDRVLSLRPVTREALIFLGQLKALSVNAAGVGLGPQPLKSKSKQAVDTIDVRACRRAAGLVGRWLANQTSTAFVLQTLGVRP